MDSLKQSGLPPKRLELEITETLLLETSSQVPATLHALRALGVRICMDDFGTGYASLSYLRSFPFHKIKIDQSFVRDLATNPDAQAIIRSIVSLAKGLDVNIIAEGIEPEAELSRLARRLSRGPGLSVQPRPAQCGDRGGSGRRSAARMPRPRCKTQQRRWLPSTAASIGRVCKRRRPYLARVALRLLR